MDTTQWVIFLAVVFGAIIVIYIDSNRKSKKRIIKMLENGWGQVPNKKMSSEQFENISHYFRNNSKSDNTIDDITWNDLDMDRVFMMINNTHSSVGQEYLYRMLRLPESDPKDLIERDRLSSFFASNEKARIDVQKKYLELGYASSISVTDYIDMIATLIPGSNIFHYAVNALLATSVMICIFLNAQWGLLIAIGMLGVAIISYYKQKGIVEHYFVCVRHIVRMISCAKDFKKLNIPELSEYNEEFERLGRIFESVVKYSTILSTGSVNGSLAEIALDYLRMITHIDLIKFNGIVKKINKNVDEVYELIENLGKIEACIAIASFRELLPYWSIPELSNDSGTELEVVDVYHPLIEKPVTNSIDVSKSVLLTGSNASGKSTFLKTIAINAILSQTIYTSTSSKYNANCFRIYSSMALKDDLSNSESYYIVEIKALKRIIDEIGSGNVPVLCFVDEVLRGTNTIERIAASSQILYSFAKHNVMTFAATHDIELTTILEKHYENYHFQEEVIDDNIIFNYRLFEGRATSRNAIKLLGIMGYDKEIIDTSENMAQTFAGTGKWTNIE